MDLLSKLRNSLSDRYDIQRQIGAGGMATVYLARDLRHDRPVALKLLSPELGAVLGPDRFLSEIRVTANLHHPNLLPLFDSGEADGQLYYVMPYVEGETLRARLDRERQLPVEEAIRLTVAVAGALDYAHRHGVIHRDLKPENILIHEDQPLVADFGIALAVSKAGGERVTQSGLSLGTPQYMSPEQATGDRVIDARTDVYSLGAVLYEMLSGDPPHTGSTAQAIIARLLTEKPRSVRAVRQSVPEHVEIAVQKALEKLPADRFATARQFSEALTNPSATTGRLTSGSNDPAPSWGARAISVRWAFPVAGAAVLVSAAAISVAALQYRNRTESTDSKPIRFEMSLGKDVRINRLDALPIAISPDGRTIAYSGLRDGRSQIFIRSLEDLEPRVVAGTIGGGSPFFSPDGASIGFIAGSKLWRVSLNGGVPTSLMDVDRPDPLAWMTDGRIIHSTAMIGGRRSGLSTLSAAGGTPKPIFSSDSTAGENLAHPVVSGDVVLFNSNGPGSFDDDFLALGSLKSGKFVRSTVLASRAIGYLAGAIIIIQINGSIAALPADPSNLQVAGEPITVMNGVLDAWIAALSKSGNLVYMQFGEASNLVLMDVAGGSKPLLREPGRYMEPRFSPDGKRILLAIADRGRGIWNLDVESGTLTRLALSDDMIVDRPDWTSDGKRIVFRGRKGSALQFYWVAADGSTVPTNIPVPAKAGSVIQELVVSPDMRWTVYRIVSQRRSDLYLSPIDGSGEMRPFAISKEDEYSPRFSPDGKWVAYSASAEGAPGQVYVKQFPEAAGRVQVSVTGGSSPMWSPDGQTLYYLDPENLVAARVSTSGSFKVVSRVALFKNSFAASDRHSNFDVSPSGRDFMMVQESAEESKAIVVVNWAKELKSRLAADSGKN